MSLPLPPWESRYHRDTGDREGGSADRRSPSYVRWLQTSLNRVLPANLSADGRMGPRTRAAVMALQRSRRLTPDGVAGPATERALIAAGAPPPPIAVAGAMAPPQAMAPVSTDLAVLAAPTTRPTAANIVAIMRAICRFHGIPFVLGLTVLDHESRPGPLTRSFAHNDGLMQTTRPARANTIPRIPRPLARTLLGVPAQAAIDDGELSRRLHAAFRSRVAVQLAVGVQELVEGLRAFNGYVAPAMIAYNAGRGNAAHIVTLGQGKQRPAGTDDARWESMCRFGAALLHQLPSTVNVERGRWRCDANIPDWYSEFRVRDAASGLLLISYQYLRRVPACIRRGKPSEPCTAARHKVRQDGSGEDRCKDTRYGILDKLYDPRRLRRELVAAAGTALTPIAPDTQPLKAEGEQIVKKPLASTPMR